MKAIKWIIPLILVILGIIGLWFIISYADGSETVTLLKEKNLIISRKDNRYKITTHTPLWSSAPWDRIPKSVYTVIQECNYDIGICYPDIQNLTMKNRGSGNYQIKDIALRHQDTTDIKCDIIILRKDGNWIKYIGREIEI